MELPELLKAEIRKMRRNPEDFIVLRQGRCRLCWKKNALDLGHPQNPTNAGSWCPVHGWLNFDSVKIRPIGEEVQTKRRRRAA
jgi:hypothetical protein